VFRKQVGVMKVRTTSNLHKSTIKFPLKGKGCQVVVSVLIVFVRHLGTFVNASHNWYTVSPLPKIDDASHCSSDFHNSNLFSEHLGTHCMLEMQWSEMQ